MLTSGPHLYKFYFFIFLRRVVHFSELFYFFSQFPTLEKSTFLTVCREPPSSRTRPQPPGIRGEESLSLTPSLPTPLPPLSYPCLFISLLPCLSLSPSLLSSPGPSSSLSSCMSACACSQKHPHLLPLLCSHGSIGPRGMPKCLLGDVVLKQCM